MSSSRSARWAVIAVSVGAALLGACGGGGGSAKPAATKAASASTKIWALDTEALRLINGATGKVERTVALGGAALAYNGSSVWVATTDGHAVEVDAATGAIKRKVATGDKEENTRRIAASASDVYVCDRDGMWQISGHATAAKELALPEFSECKAVAIANGTVWVAMGGLKEKGLYTLSATGEFTPAFPAQFEADRLLPTRTSVYTSCNCQGAFYRYDIKKKDGTFVAAGPVSDIVEVGDQIWFGVNNGIARKDIKTKRFMRGIPIDKEFTNLRLAFADGAMWAAHGALYRIDPSTLRVKTVVPPYKNDYYRVINDFLVVPS
jgi:hypothetical protein